MTKRKKKDPFKPGVELPTPKVTVFGQPSPLNVGPGYSAHSGHPGANGQSAVGMDNVWTSEKVDAILYKAEEEGLDFKKIPNPFFDANPEFKAPNILWEYTSEELDEIKKCASDAIYFSKYCQVMTDEGLTYIKLRDYQEDIIRAYQHNRFSIFCAPRQIGKCLLPTSTVRVNKLKTKRLSDFLPSKKGILSRIKNFLFNLYSSL
jgi:hypothetical protein